MHEVSVWSSLKHANIAHLTGITTLAEYPGYSMVSAWMSNGDLLVYLEKIDLSTINFAHHVSHLVRTPSSRPHQCLLRSFQLLDVIQGIEYLHNECRFVHGDVRAVCCFTTWKHSSLIRRISEKCFNRRKGPSFVD